MSLRMRHPKGRLLPGYDASPQVRSGTAEACFRPIKMVNIAIFSSFDRYLPKAAQAQAWQGQAAPLSSIMQVFAIQVF